MTSRQTGEKIQNKVDNTDVNVKVDTQQRQDNKSRTV